MSSTLTQPLSELALSVGAVATQSATTAGILAAYHDHLECDVVAIYTRTAASNGAVNYRRRAAVPASAPDHDAFQAVIARLPTNREDDERFRATLPLVDTVEDTQYYILELPGVGVLVLLAPERLSAGAIAALEPLNERVAGLVARSSDSVTASEDDGVGQPGRRHEPESYDQLRWIIDLFPQPVFVKDETGQYLVANEALAEMFGTTVEDIEGSTDDEVLASRTEVTRVQEHDMSVIEANKPIEITGERVTDAAGKRRVFDTTKVPYDTLDDGRRAVLGVANDVTERREREIELERNRDFLEKVQESASIGAWEVDHNAETLRWEDEVARITGYPLAYEPSITDTISLYHPEDRPTIEAAFETLMANGTPFDLELRIITTDDDVRWVRTRADPRYDDEESFIGARGIVQDIHERKARELELEQLKNRFERFAGAVRYGFTLIRPDYSEMLYQNPAAADVYGVSEDALRDDPLVWLESVHPDDRDRVEHWFETQEPATLDGTQKLEFRLDHPDRGRRWLLIRSHAVMDNGNVAHLASVTTDITERRRLEDELRASEDSLRRLVKIASDTDRSVGEKRSRLLALGCDYLDLPYGFLNRLEGDEWTLVDAEGTHPSLRVGGPAPAGRPCRRQPHGQESVVAIEDIRRDEGSVTSAEQRPFDCYLGSTVIVDGERYGTLCFADESPRTREFGPSERAFVELLVQWLGYELTGQKFERRLRELNETARELMATETPAEIAAVATESADDVLEIPETAIWAYDDRREALVPQAVAADEQMGINELPTFERTDRNGAGDESRGETLVWNAFNSGKRFVCDDSDTVLRTATDEPEIRSQLLLPLGTHGLLVAGSSDRSAFSETDRNLLEVLAATVEAALDRAEHEQLLRSARADLERSNQKLEEFAYAASHDMKEPLRSTANYLTLFEELYEPGETLDEAGCNLLEQAVAGTTRLRSMIDGLLEYSRVEAIAEWTDSVALETVVDRAILNLSVRVNETDGTVTRDSLPTVQGDSRLLVQLFQNLLDNGLKYSDADQPQVHVALVDEVAQSPDTVASETGTNVATDCYHLRVEDNGTGMDASAVARAFDVFERHGRRDDDGTGMGLPLCQRIVEHHGGAITIESEPGSGTAVNLWLPAAES